MVNRSSCASGSGYVPSYSIGFCVAITMNGRASSYETPSTVTCCSCMHSSKADCVFGEARLISSTRRRLAKTGPGLNWNSFERWLNMFTPVTSDGSRSGVHDTPEVVDQASDRLGGCRGLGSFATGLGHATAPPPYLRSPRRFGLWAPWQHAARRQR